MGYECAGASDQGMLYLQRATADAAPAMQQLALGCGDVRSCVGGVTHTWEQGATQCSHSATRSHSMLGYHVHQRELLPQRAMAHLAAQRCTPALPWKIGVQPVKLNRYTSISELACMAWLVSKAIG
jgi:hypothetical protein